MKYAVYTRWKVVDKSSDWRKWGEYATMAQAEEQRERAESTSLPIEVKIEPVTETKR